MRLTKAEKARLRRDVRAARAARREAASKPNPDRLICVLCKEPVDVQYWTDDNGNPAKWSDGHSAYPLAEGRCCSACEQDKVLPARLGQHQRWGGLEGLNLKPKGGR